MSIKVLIADDAILFREGVKSFFGRDSGILIVGEADDALDVAAQTVAAGADVVLLDEDLPGLDCFDTIRLIRDRRPGTQVLVFAEEADHARAARVIEAGAAGYVLKDIDPQNLARAITDVHKGCTRLNPRSTRDVFEQFTVLARERTGHNGFTSWT